MTVSKTVSFRSPYIGRTFQHLVDLLQGRDGYLAGGEVTEAGGLLTVAPYAFVQDGVVCEESEDTTGISVPAGPEPWFVLASISDDEPESGITLVATGDLTQVLGGNVVIGYKTNGVWRNPRSMSIDATQRQSAAEPGSESGFTPYPQRGGAAPVRITDVGVSGGRLVGPAGERKSFGTPPAEPMAAFDTNSLGLMRDGVAMGFPRTDYVVFRENEDGTGGFVHVYGNAQGMGGTDGSAVLDEAGVSGGINMHVSGTLAGSWGARGDRSRWHAFGVGADLYVAGFDHASDTTVSPGLLQNGSTAVTSVEIAGPNSDGDLVVLYADGATIQVLTFSPGASPAVTNGPVALVVPDPSPDSTQGFSHIRAALGPGDVLHVVAEEDVDSGAPDKNVVYLKATASATGPFGASLHAGVRFVSGSNDTLPTIALDRRGHVHIAYTTGVLDNHFGTLRYVELDAQVNEVVAVSPNDFGGNADPYDPAGLSTETFDDVSHPHVLVTPHDEVYVVALGYPNGGASRSEVVVYSPSFARRFGGIELIHLSQVFGYESTPVEKTSLAAFVDDFGAIFLGVSSANGLYFARLDTDVVGDGVVGRSYLEDPTIHDSTLCDGAVTGITELRLTPSGLGGAIWGYVSASSIVRVTGQRARGRRPTFHGKDVPVACFEAATRADAATVIPDEASFRASTIRKGTGATIVVGEGGDYGGSSGLVEALGEAARTGADVYVKGGQYIAGNPITIPGGTKLRAERNAELYFPGFNTTVGEWVTMGFPFGTGIPGSVIAGEENVLVLGAALTGATQHIRPGDAIVLDTDPTNFNQVVQVLDSNRIAMQNTFPVTGGDFYTVYASNVDMSGVAVHYDNDDGGGVVINQLRHSRIAGLYRDNLVNLSVAGITATGCESCVFEKMDFGTGHSQPEPGLSMEGGYGNVVQQCSFGDTGGHLSVANTERRLAVSSCTVTKDSALTDVVYHFSPGRVPGDVVQLVNSAGGINSTGASGSATRVADRLIDNTHMLNPVTFSDSDHTTLPSASVSILEQLKNESVSRELTGINGVHHALAPTIISGTTIEVEDGYGIAAGKVVNLDSPVSNSDATGASTHWSYYATTAGTVLAVNALPVVDGPYLLVAYGQLDGTGTAFAKFLDMRRFVATDSYRNAIVVNTGEGFGAFATLQGALEWLKAAAVSDKPRAEVIITELLDMTAAGAIPIQVDLDDFKSLTIRGAGDNAGVKSAADANVFEFSASASTEATYRALRISDLVFKSTYASTPTAGYAVAFVGAEVESVIIERCKVMSDDPAPQYGIFGFTHVDATSGLGNAIIADNDVNIYGPFVSVEGVSTYSERLTIRNNRVVKQDTVAAYSCIEAYVTSTGDLAIVDNSIDGDYAIGIDLPSTSSLAVVRGNYIRCTTRASGSQVGLVAIDNARIDSNTFSITGVADAVGIDTQGQITHIVGNSIVASGVGVQTTNAPECVISANRIYVNGDAIDEYSKPCIALKGTSFKTNVTGNICLSWGDVEVAGTKYHSMIVVESDAYGCSIVGNELATSFSAVGGGFDGRAGGIHTGAPRTTITGNTVSTVGGPGAFCACVAIKTGATDCVVVGNHLATKTAGLGAFIGSFEDATLEKGLSGLTLAASADFATFKSAHASTYNVGANTDYTIP